MRDQSILKLEKKPTQHLSTSLFLERHKLNILNNTHSSCHSVYFKDTAESISCSTQPSPKVLTHT